MTQNDTRARPGLRAALAIATAVVALVFAFSVAERRPWFGRLTMSIGDHMWLTGSTVIFAGNWYDEGGWRLSWLLLDIPPSIELNDLTKRSPYLSYPPGAALPIYALARLTGARPGPALVMAYNLANQFAIAVLLGWLVAYLLLDQGAPAWLAASAAALAGAIEVLTPCAMYYHQNVFFADQAALLPFVAFVGLEVARSEGRWQRARGALQLFLLAYGVSTDWLFVFVALAAYAKRWLCGELGAGWREHLKHSAIFWVGPALVAAGFVAQVVVSGQLDEVLRKAQYRLGTNKEGVDEIVYFGGFVDRFWGLHFRDGYGRAGAALVIASAAGWLAAAAFLVWRRWSGRTISPDLRRLAAAIGLLLVPCLAQTYALRNHSAVHGFSTLKYAPVVAAVPFFLLPALLWRCWCEGVGEAPTPRAWAYVGAACLTGATLFLLDLFPNRLKLFPPDEPEQRAKMQAIGEQTGYADVVFSPHFEVEKWPPQPVALTRKLVYRALTPARLREKARPLLEGVAGEVRIVVVFEWGPPPSWVELVRTAERTEAAGLIFYRLPALRELRMENGE